MKPATKRRFQELQHRKNFLPTLAVTLTLWAIVGIIVYFTDPILTGAIPLFFSSLLFALIFTFSLLFANTRRGIIAASALTIFLFLRYLGVGSLLNFILIGASSIAFEFYFRKRA